MSSVLCDNPCVDHVLYTSANNNSCNEGIICIICIIVFQVPIPDDMKTTVSARRAELVERIAEVDETVGELFLMEEPVDDETLRQGIRRATLALKFVPVFMGR